MSTEPPTNLPLDDKSGSIKYSYPFIVFFSTLFVVLRIGNSFRNKKYTNLSDWLLVLAQVTAIVGTVFAYLSAFKGAGKHVWDPSVTQDDLAQYLKNLWFGQFFNLTAMAALKFSICAFMLQLNFSQTFRCFIWISAALQVAFNVVFPYVIMFGECNPIAKHWDASLLGYYWPAKPRMVSGYCGAAANIASDIFFTSAPLAYTRSVQLPRRAMWGVRAVFLLGFLATIISAVKLYEIKALDESKDMPYESINLSILSVTEVMVGTLTASLPPLRRAFENTLNRIFPESVIRTSRKTMANSYVLPDYGDNLNTRRSKRDDHESDDSSEKTILQDAGNPGIHVMPGKSGEIVRTTHVSLTIDNTKSRSRNEDWA